MRKPTARVVDYRFSLSDGTAVWIILRVENLDDRLTKRLHEAVDKLAIRTGDAMTLQMHDPNVKQ